VEWVGWKQWLFHSFLSQKIHEIVVQTYSYVLNVHDYSRPSLHFLCFSVISQPWNETACYSVVVIILFLMWMSLVWNVPPPETVSSVGPYILSHDKITSSFLQTRSLYYLLTCHIQSTSCIFICQFYWEASLQPSHPVLLWKYCLMSKLWQAILQPVIFQTEYFA